MPDTAQNRIVLKNGRVDEIEQWAQQSAGPVRIAHLRRTDHGVSGTILKHPREFTAASLVRYSTTLSALFYPNPPEQLLQALTLLASGSPNRSLILTVRD